MDIKIFFLLSQWPARPGHSRKRTPVNYVEQEHSTPPIINSRVEHVLVGPTVRVWDYAMRKTVTVSELTQVEALLWF